MRVRITKRERRNQLVCVRADGSRTSADLGPGLPYHDLAHYVVERRFGLRKGFFGNIAAGYTIEALSDKEVIKSLGSESMVAEILARALGSVATGACRPDQFSLLVNEELANLGVARLENIRPAGVLEMLEEFQDLAARYQSLSRGDSLDLVFD
jgi:hypothetical protein